MCVNASGTSALQSPPPMWPNLSPDTSAACETAAPGEVLRVRQEKLGSVLYLVSGRVQMGIREEGQMRHQLGVVEGPFWLDASAAMLNLPCAVDIVAETRVQLRRQSLESFQRGLETLPKSVQTLLRDLATGYRQQTELAISRLAQDAEARCAQWLLQHAQHDDSGAMSVILNQRKRLIAAQLGIAPETFSRVLRNLREHGLILGSGNVLKLPQPSALELVAAG
jgi:CRP-like cAMP-binding protein